MGERKDKDTRQWRQVAEARESLRNHANYPVLNSLEESWQELDAFYGTVSIGGRNRRVVERDGLERTSDNPLSSLMFFVEMGFYPPPELLLGLLDSWRDYLEGGGTITLEEAFLGKPKRKAGTFAKRDSTKLTRMILAHQFAELRKNGLTQAAAAEEIVNRYGLQIDADSLVRMVRKTFIFSATKRKK